MVLDQNLGYFLIKFLILSKNIHIFDFSSSLLNEGMDGKFNLLIIF